MRVCCLCLIIYFISAWILFTVPKVFSAVNSFDIVERMNSTAVPFVMNQGQINDAVLFYARTFSGVLFVTKSGELIYNLPKMEVTGSGNGQCKKHKDRSDNLVFKEKLVNAGINKISARKQALTQVHHFKGNDSGSWQSNTPTYEELSFGEVYDGIEMRLKAFGNNVEKLFYINPGYDPSLIRLSISGAERLGILESGVLETTTRLGQVHFTKPVAWQEINGKRIPVAVSYEIFSNEEELIYGFHVGDYDKSCSLVIDPLLASTYLGGTRYDSVQSIAFDSNGNVYVTGYSSSMDYPTTDGVYDQTHGGGWLYTSDIIVSKLSPDLSTLLSSTYLGGKGDEEGRSINLDSSGNVYVTGFATSSDFPVTENGYGPGGGGDIIVSKLSPDLSTLLASTYLGGTRFDTPRSMSLDSKGNIYITGRSYSNDYPTTAGAYDENHNGQSDIVISKLSSNLSTLVASTYLGGSGWEEAWSIIFDNKDSVYVAGHTDSADYPATTGSYDQSFNGGDDFIVSKLSSDLSSLIASTYLGGTDDDTGGQVIAGNADNIYLAGNSWSTDFPTTIGSYDQSHNGIYDIIISKLTSNLDQLVASTYLGGISRDAGQSIALDMTGNVYVAGFSSSGDYPTTSEGYDRSRNGLYDVVITKISANLNILLASTFLGGEDTDYGHAIALDSSGNVFVAGVSRSRNYPITDGAYDQFFIYFGDYFDIIISKLSSDLSGPPYSSFPWPIFFPAITGNDPLD